MNSDRIEMNIAEAKKHFSDLLGRVAFGGQTVMILRRGKPIAKLVPATSADGDFHPGQIEGWMEEGDPFLSLMDEIVSSRTRHAPRILSKVPGRSRRKGRSKT